MNRETKHALTLLTKLAYGDVTLVDRALAEQGEKSVDAVIDYIRENRDRSRRPPRPVTPAPR